MGITLSGSQGLSSPQANGYVILSSCNGIHYCCWSAQVQVIAAVFVAVSILKLRSKDLSRNWTLTSSTGRVIVLDSVIDAIAGLKDLSRAETYTPPFSNPISKPPSKPHPDPY
ncbi:hypothetical protein Tco_0439109 [Tanacetum coccineum]